MTSYCLALVRTVSAGTPPSLRTGARGSRGGRLLVPLLIAGLSGCADTYLVAPSSVERLGDFSAATRSRLAIPAVRMRGHRSTWVHPDLLLFGADEVLSGGFRRVPEVPNRRRISPLGLASLIVGVIGVSVGAVLVGTAGSCSSQGALPCLTGGGDAAMTVTLLSAGLLFTGLGLSLARAGDLHPAEVVAGSDNLLFLGSPADIRPPARTPLE